MKKTITFFAFACILASPRAEEINLLSGAFTTEDAQMDNKDAFYNVWSCNYPDGTEMDPSILPYSVFSMVDDSFMYRFNGNLITFPGDDSVNGFVQNTPIVILTTGSYGMHDYTSYSVPIDVEYEGTYNLKVKARKLADTSDISNFFNKNGALVITLDKDLDHKTFAVETENGSPVVKVRDSSNDLVTSTFKVLKSYSSGIDPMPFEVPLNVTKEHKYLTIYGPSGRIGANIELSSDDITTLSPETNIGVFEDCTPEYYDLCGRRIDTGNGAVPPGLYIVRKGNTTSKQLINSNNR